MESVSFQDLLEEQSLAEKRQTWDRAPHLVYTMSSLTKMEGVLPLEAEANVNCLL